MPNAGKDTEKLNPHIMPVGGKMLLPLWGTVWQFLQKLNIYLPYDPAMALLAFTPEKWKTCLHKTCTYL